MQNMRSILWSQQLFNNFRHVQNMLTKNCSTILDIDVIQHAVSIPLWSKPCWLILHFRMPGHFVLLSTAFCNSEMMTRAFRKVNNSGNKPGKCREWELDYMNTKKILVTKRSNREVGEQMYINSTESWICKHLSKQLHLKHTRNLTAQRRGMKEATYTYCKHT
jgi:hypothetical protein